MVRKGRRAARWHGFTLLEVMLASTILLGAVIVLGELAHLGIRNAAAARDLTTAEFLCRGTMNEITSGILPADEVESAVVTSAPGWVYSVEVVPLEHAGLSSLRVTVAQDLPEEKRPITFSLFRWVPAELDRSSANAVGTLGSGTDYGARAGGTNNSGAPTTATPSGTRGAP
ncbi:MAG: hypothetical protein R3C10_26785 [Pirellulales bacterium]